MELSFAHFDGFWRRLGGESLDTHMKLMKSCLINFSCPYRKAIREGWCRRMDTESRLENTGLIR